MVNKESVVYVAAKDTAAEKVGKEMDVMEQLVVKLDMNACTVRRIVLGSKR